ncbi:alpha/beta hydrolase [Haloferacaceae archaeon DSL9]
MTRRKPKNRLQRHLRRPARESYATRRVEFDSGEDGDRCAGTLYLPDRPESPPVIVMAPGFGAWRSFGLPAFAERFAEAGYAALTFDYRGFNDSDGEPRGMISPAKQRVDYEAALDFVRRLSAVDGSRIVLWGSSFSGGHVLSVAADDRRVAAVVAQVPFVDGRAAARRNGVTYAAKALALGLRDRLGSVVGSGADVRIVADPDTFAVINDPGSKRAYFDLIDRDSTWQNRTPGRVLLSIPRYRPISRVEEVDCPTLLLAGTDDQLAPSETVENAAELIDGSTLVRFPAGHFDVYGDAFETVVGYQLTFLESVFDADAVR